MKSLAFALGTSLLLRFPRTAYSKRIWRLPHHVRRASRTGQLVRLYRRAAS